MDIYSPKSNSSLISWRLRHTLHAIFELGPNSQDNNKYSLSD